MINQLKFSIFVKLTLKICTQHYMSDLPLGSKEMFAVPLCVLAEHILTLVLPEHRHTDVLAKYIYTAVLVIKHKDVVVLRGCA